MTGVFISYTRSDEALARRVRLGLKSLGVNAIWDESMPSVDWQDFLHEKITDLSAVIVIWTPKSKSSKSVKAEARLAHGVDKLINVLSGMPQPPWPFDDINGLSLDGWAGTTPHVSWTRLIETVDGLLEKRDALARGTLIAALAQQEAEMRDRRAAIPKAERALKRTLAEYEKLEDKLSVAQAEFDQAAKQIVDLQQLKLSKAVMLAAHAEHDEAKTALLAARQQVTDSAEALSGEKAAVVRLKYDFDNWLISIGADIDPEKADVEGMQVGAEDVLTDAALPLLSTKKAGAPTASPTTTSDVEPASGAVVAVGSQTVTSAESGLDADPQPEPETASLETGAAMTVPGSAPLPEPSPTANPVPAPSAEAMKQPPPSVSNNKETIRRPQHSTDERRYWPAVIALVALLLLLSIFYFTKASKPVESVVGNATEMGIAAPQNETNPNQSLPLGLTLEAPEWLLGSWGIEGDCTNTTNRLGFIKEAGGKLGVLDGDSGKKSIEAIKAVFDPVLDGEQIGEQIWTSEARYVLDYTEIGKVIVFPNGLNPYRLKKCRNK